MRKGASAECRADFCGQHGPERFCFYRADSDCGSLPGDLSQIAAGDRRFTKVLDLIQKGQANKAVPLDSTEFFRALVALVAGNSHYVIGTVEQQLTKRDPTPAVDLAPLQQAVQRGYKDAAALKNEATFDSLRDRADFQKLLQKLEGKGK